jgi:hypothetical protein
MSEPTRCGAIVRRRADEREAGARRELASMFFALGVRSSSFCTNWRDILAFPEKAEASFDAGAS